MNNDNCNNNNNTAYNINLSMLPLVNKKTIANLKIASTTPI